MIHGARRVGAASAVAEAGGRLIVRRGPHGRNYARSLATRLLALDDPPTAIFAANNFIAFGAVRALRDLGLKVPDDISVVAFDDLPVEWVAEPFLTVAAQPAYDIGRRAAELMIDRLEGERTAAGESVVLPFELIVRRSTAAPRVRPMSPPMKPPADDVATRRGEGELPLRAVRVP